MPLLAETITPFDWQRLLWSADAPPLFLLEVAFRCLITYLLTLAALRITGRRGVRQLSLFELSIILALGSASGDAMFYHDVALSHIVVVFAVVMLLYVLLNRLTERAPGFSDWLEGKPVKLVADGALVHEALRNQNLTHKELFGELRQQQVEHLGQVRMAYIEATGQISAFFYEDEDVRPGLPILPELRENPLSVIGQAGTYACSECGHVETLAPTPALACPVCRCDKWLPTRTGRRVA
ncbi:DUF421 domain-containing protein [Hymenobacter properus]|uniref:DUF421 domain-containing protein n=1 Tax=Hymenobacter properus TaxID=2791026 RepID=A0A931FLQ8_9BACT|nr:DUF421 domain-containing protein [Hymenobacter properus]MBF9142276.1 DUF421 domain-containing protein [Hymenobacter properus]MBR7721083.1 DUF421 domain-containing protein [Microvirga sp. SRT04]